MAVLIINEKIKDKILNEFNEDLYRNFNMTMTDAGELYGWGYKYMHKILNRVFKNYGPGGLKRETKYIIQYPISQVLQTRSNPKNVMIGPYYPNSPILL